jgi:hypothetical protein
VLVGWSVWDLWRVNFCLFLFRKSKSSKQNCASTHHVLLDRPIWVTELVSLTLLGVSLHFCLNYNLYCTIYNVCSACVVDMHNACVVAMHNACVVAIWSSSVNKLTSTDIKRLIHYEHYVKTYYNIFILFSYVLAVCYTKILFTGN